MNRYLQFNNDLKFEIISDSKHMSNQNKSPDSMRSANMEGVLI